MPNQYTKATQGYVIERDIPFPSSLKTLIPDRAKQRAENAAAEASLLPSKDRKHIVNWILSSDQRRNMPPLSIFANTRGKPIEFCAVILACVREDHPSEVVLARSLFNAYTAMHRAAIDTRMVRIAAWALGVPLKHSEAQARANKMRHQGAVIPSDQTETVPEAEVVSLVPPDANGNPETDAELTRLRSDVEFLSGVVDTLSSQLETLMNAVRALTERALAPNPTQGVTLAQLALAGMEIHIVPSRHGGAK